MEIKLTTNYKKGNTWHPYFNRMVCTINSILSLFYNQNNQKFKYLMTTHLNQDFLKNTFSIYKQRGEYGEYHC